MYLFAILLIAAGFYHFVNPAFYDPIMPDWFPKALANAAGGFAEIVIGIMILVPKTKFFGIWAACALMAVFLPLHIWDLTKAKPMVGSHMAAVIRLLIQLGLIGWLYWRATKE